jgi:hypothetical protein
VTALIRSKPDPRRAGLSIARSAVVASLFIVACLGAPDPATAAPAGASNVSPRIICGRDVGMQAGTGFVRDDWWDERVCIAVTPRVAGFTVTTNVTPRPAGVVAYPYVLAAGWAWGVHAPLTSWPVRISDSGDPRLTFRTRGNPPGVYNRSADLWFDPEPLHTGHGSAEVMVWLTARGYQHSKIYTRPIARVRLDGFSWVLDYWMSKHRLCVPGGCHRFRWPLIIFARTHAKYPNRVVSLPLRPFVTRAIATGLLPASDYWLSVACGAELQAGAKGLGGTCSVTGTTAPGSG